jgi:hypothetical protein
MAMCGCGAGGQNEDEMRRNLVIYPLGFRLTDPVAGAHYPLADGPGARRSAVRTIMASLLDVVSRAGFTAQGNSKMYRPAGLALLIGVYIVVCCLSFRLGYPYYHDYYIFYDGARLGCAFAVVTGFAAAASLFVYAGFRFGYLVGFYAYSMILGYLWLNCFSQFQYDHVATGIPAAVSAVAFLLPALLITSPIARPYEMPERIFWRLIMGVLVFCAVTAATAAAYNFRVVSISQIYDFRDQLRFPMILNYCIGAATGVLLPFAFACFTVKNRHWLAIVSLLVLISFYPSTLSKTAFFTPAWLVTLALISRFFGARRTTILSLLLPILVGIL